MRVSIITPSFGQLDWLRICIASVRDQCDSLWPGSSFDVEHIVQDAGTPGIEVLREELESIFPGKAKSSGSYSLRIVVEKDSGMYDAVNRGLRKATGDICAYLNCDEQYLPGALNAVVDRFENDSKLGMLFGDTVIVDANGQPRASRPSLIPSIAHSTVGGTLAVYTASTFFRRSIIEPDLCFNDGWRILGDTDWLVRVLEKNIRMGLLRQRTSAFTISCENLSFSAAAEQEIAMWIGSAPNWMKVMRLGIIAHYRLRKLLAGHYGQKSYSYSIYTRDSPESRKEFFFKLPTPFLGDLKRNSGPSGE